MSLVVSLEDLFNEEGKFAKASHWERLPLGNVVKVLNGFPLKSTAFTKDKGFPVIRIRDLKFNKSQTYYSDDFPKEYIVDDGDFLVGMDGDFICYEWGGGKAVLNQRVLKLIPNENFIHKRFLFYGINMYLDAIQKVTSSVTVKHLSSLDVLKIPFPLAPLPEQHRIVAKLDELIEKIERSKKRLEKIPLILKRFRQSVLAAAVNGKLTEGWRGKTKNEGEWRETLLEEITEVVGGYAYKSTTFTPIGKNKILRIGNIKPFKLFLEYSPVFVDDKIAKETERFSLKKNEIAISMTGTKYKRDYGYAAICKDETNCFINQRVSKISCSDKISPDYLCYWMQTDDFRNHFFSGETGNVNQGNVGMDGIKKAIINLPSVKEQLEIVRKVEALFAFADKIETRYTKAKAQFDKLPQALLAKAFKGELVPQNPKDEPASVLLERIKKEKVNGTKKKNKVLTED